MRQGGVEVGRLRVHGDTEPLRLRLGVERVLGAADLVGTRLPPAAVLVVRTLRDPMPGRLDVSRPGPDRDWEQRVRDDLDDLVLRAARPASAPADPGAPAVVFADRAELLACAWRELRHTGRASSWWWRALRIDDLPRLLLALADAVHTVPAVVASLEASGELERCTALLGEVAAESLAIQVASAFGRPGLVAEVRGRLVTAVPPHPVSPGTARPSEAASGVAAPSAPVSPAALARAVLAEVCRALVAPAALRPQVVTATPGPAAPANRSSVAAGRPPIGSTGESARLEHDVPGAATTAPPGAPEWPGTPQGRSAPPVRSRPPALRGEHRPEGADRVPEPGSPAPADPDGGPTGPTGLPGPLADLVESELVVDTSLGGVFHLVQVAQALGLYADFTSPAATGIRLGPWDFVTLVARGLDVGSRRDPVWRLLADLQGRDPARPPGVGFRPPRTWRTPDAWLAPVDAPGPWRWRDDASRSALLHPSGFVVAEGASLDRVHECARYAVVRCLDANPAPYDGPARGRWVAHLAAYLRVRLAGALGVPPSRAGRTLCRRPAYVHVTPTRVDVVSELADLPIEVRRAGLDRDLGFVPAAGRTIGFVFR